MTLSLRPLKTYAMAASAFALLAACEGGFDFDLRGGLGQKLDTSQAAVTATAPRPSPDSRGIISYPNYQVAIARRGDTVSDVAARIGANPQELAQYNAIKVDDPLREGEIIALPSRVAEPSTGQVINPSDVDITALAGSAIDNAAPTTVETETLESAPTTEVAAVPENAQIGFEPIRHTVQRGETAFTIARLYGVTVRALAEWNGLGQSFTIRENQILLIPPAQPAAPSSSPRPEVRETASATATTAPGEGSPTPTPPSATKPLPAEQPTKAVEKPASPDLSKTQTTTKSSGQMGYPVSGKVIRPYSKGKNNGIDLSASAGSPVAAAADGTVAAITTDAEGVKIIVVRHPQNLMTVYYNVENVGVTKGTPVKRGQKLAAIPSKDNYLHFEVRKGFDSVDPAPYLK